MRANSHFVRLIGSLLFGFCSLSSAKAQVPDRLWADVTINGRPARFVFDTGAPGLCLFPKGAQRLGLSFTNPPENFKPAPGRLPAGTTEECEVKIGSQIERGYLQVMEIPSAGLDLDCDGLIGWRLVRNNIILFDASLDRVECIERVPMRAASWLKLSLRKKSDTLVLELPQTGGKPSLLDIDSGSTHGVTLSWDKWREWKTAHKNQPATLDAYYSPNSGFVVAEESWARDLQLGPLRLFEVPVAEPGKADIELGNRSKRKHYQARLGMAALRRLDLIVDAKAGFAYLHSKTNPPPSYDHNKAGAVFAPADLNSDDLIAHVIKSSPAYEAGIRNGDLLLKVENRDVTKWRTGPAHVSDGRLTGPPGSKVDLTLKRHDKAYKTTVVLRRILPPDTNHEIRPGQN